METLVKLSDFCKKNQRKFYISDNIKLAKNVKADGVYISSSNKKNEEIITRGMDFPVATIVIGYESSWHQFQQVP